jgi:septum formation protein
LITGIILASASPRREQLLRQVGCEFRVEVSQAEENNAADLPPAELVRVHALAKARAVAATAPAGEIVIGADTLVVLAGKVYGKPKSAADAESMLAELAGRTHSVWSGVAVVTAGRCLTEAVETKVTLARLTPEQIRRYVATGEPLDKAGAYAVQERGALFVERLAGCYFNVVGLPLQALSRLLAQVGVELL